MRRTRALPRLSVRAGNADEKSAGSLRVEHQRTGRLIDALEPDPAAVVEEGRVALQPAERHSALRVFASRGKQRHRARTDADRDTRSLSHLMRVSDETESCHIGGGMKLRVQRGTGGGPVQRDHRRDRRREVRRV